MCLINKCVINLHSTPNKLSNVDANNCNETCAQYVTMATQGRRLLVM